MNDAKPGSVAPGAQIALRVLIAIALLVFLPLSWGVFHLVIAHAHYGFGAIPALFFATMAGTGFVFTLEHLTSGKRGTLPRPARTVLNVMVGLSCLFMLATVCAWISYALWKANLAQLAKAPGEPTYSDLVKVYFWHLVDVIPFTNVEGSLGMKLPDIQFRGWIGAAPILLFRFAVVFFVLEILRRSWRDMTSTNEATATSAR